MRAFGARGIILSGGPESVTQPGAPAAPTAVFEAGVPVLGICYGMQTMAAQLGGRVEPGAVHEFGYAEVRARGHSALLRDIEDRVNTEGHGLLDVWMSHGDRVVELPPGFKVSASTPGPANRGHGRRGASALRTAVPPRGHAYPPGRAHLRALPARHLWLRCRLERRQHHRGCSRARARAGRRRQGAARPVGRRGLLGRSSAAAQGDRRPADLRVRGPRPAAPPRGRPGDGRVRAQSRRAGHPRGRRRALLHGAGGRLGPRGQAQDHRPPVHRGLRRGGAQARGRRVPGAGDDLPRRDRIGRQQDRQGPRHQIAPQRGRPARDDEAPARRAAARVVQGRGAAHRRGTRPARSRWSIVTRSRVRGSACASSAR